MTERKPNHLANEHSPYLLQHAFNPVEWYPWGEEALKKAQDEDKLLVISIGYAACHWCHVMERESFEDEEVAAVMNRDYISVKVDREERPDIDQVYMAAAYATTGRGGWPLNVIALPGQQPLFAGTYYSRTAWLQVLNYFSGIYRHNPEELRRAAAEVAAGMGKQASLPALQAAIRRDPSFPEQLFRTWKEDLDFNQGGTRGAPKFPMPANLACLLDFGIRYRNEQALDYVFLTLERMAMGGIYDQLGGGFSRYSVDAYWQVPHFEKMLYDNAQLVSLYSKAWACRKDPLWKQVAEETVRFTMRELMTPEGLFHASLDADSEGTEGKFYAWTSDEIRKYLGDDPSLFLQYYDCRDEGNWEHGWNVLRRAMTDGEFCEKYRLDPDQLSVYLDVCRDQLFTVRSNRPRPATDTKILTCWNGLMISAMTDASTAFGQPDWLDSALRAGEAYRSMAAGQNWLLWRNISSGGATGIAFLDDYAFLAKAFLDLYQSTLEEKWLEASHALTGEAIRRFSATGGVYFTLAAGEGPGLVQEVVELADNVVPSSNSCMAGILLRLGMLLGRAEYLERAEKMLAGMLPRIRHNPAFHANWARHLMDHQAGLSLVTITGREKLAILRDLSGLCLPGTIFSGRHTTLSETMTVATGDEMATRIFVCRDKTCFQPVSNVAEALSLLESKDSFKGY